MKYQKIIIILILLIFTTGILLGPVSATHTFTDKGYTYKMSDSKYNKMKKNAKKGAQRMTKELGHPCSSYDNKIVKVTKTTKVYVYKNGKLNKKYPKQTMKLRKNGWKYTTTEVHGKNEYQIYKKTGHMNCKVEYYKGNYEIYCMAWDG